MALPFLAGLILGVGAVFAYNNFGAGGGSDIGIGNNPNPNGHPDWTFSKSAAGLADATLSVFAVIE